MARFGRPLGMTRDQRFDSKVAVSSSDECWNWTSGTNGRGYGRFNLGTRGEGQVGAHVYACERAHGPNPGGLHVMHSCDNPRCCNPRHLSYGTRINNMSDCVSRGRHKPSGVCGEEQGKALLTEDAVRYIKAHPEISGAALARSFGVNKATVYDVRAGRTWNHIT